MRGSAAAADASTVVDGAAPELDPRRLALLLEHVGAFDTADGQPRARERLERALGSDLARLLVVALSHGGRGAVARR